MHNSILILTKRLLINDYKRLLLTFFSLTIAAVVLTFVISATTSLGTFLGEQTNALVGGDIELDLSNQEALILEPIAELQQAGAVFAEKLSTNVLARANEQVVLSSLSVVSDSYPLYGEVLTENKAYSTPDPDSVLVQQNLLERLSVRVGETLTIGEAEYTIGGIVTSLPDQLTAGFSFGPVAVLSQAGFARSGIETTQSRLDYDTYIRIPEENKSRVLDSVEAAFVGSDQRVRLARDGAGRQLRVLDRVSEFLVILSILSLFLVVVNIRANLAGLVAHYSRTIALFKVLGMSPFGVVSIFTILIIIVSLIAVILGSLAGNALLAILLPYASTIINGVLVWPGITSGMLSVAVVIVVLSLLGSLSGLYSIAQLPAKTVFSGTTSGDGRDAIVREIVVGLLVSIGLFLMVWYLSSSWLLSLSAVGGLSVTYLALLAILVGLIGTLYRIRTKLSNAVRYVVNFINARGALGMSGFAALILALTALFSITGIEYSLQNDIAETVAGETPNLYLLDVQSDQVDTVREIVGRDVQLFPNVRARLQTVAGQDPSERVAGDGRFDRTFNLTYREDLLKTETISEGIFHGDTQTGAVSVESETADSLGVVLGDELVFDIQGRSVSAVVTSIRTLEESSIGIPFFYFVLSPDVVEDAPQTLFGYVYLEDDDIGSTQNTLADALPNVSSIPTADLIRYVQTISELFSKVLSGMSIPAVLLGALLVYSQLLGLTATRIRDLSLFKLLGMPPAKIKFLFFWETVTLVFGCVVIAFVLSRVANYLILSQVFDLTYQIALEPGVLVIAALVMVGVGIFVLYFSYKLQNTSARDLFFKN